MSENIKKNHKISSKSSNPLQVCLSMAKNRVLGRSGGVNILLLLLLIVVVYKSQYYKKVLQKLDIAEKLPTDALDYWALNGWTNTLQKLDYDADIAFFGNSITCMSDFQKSFPDKKVINLGYPGDTMKGMVLRMAMLKAVEPEKYS